MEHKKSSTAFASVLMAVFVLEEVNLEIMRGLNGNLFFWNSFTGEMFAKLKVSANSIRNVFVDKYVLFLLLGTMLG